MIRTIASVYGLRVVTAAVNLISVPLASRYLGLERYGLWISMSSLVAVLSLCDFGLGNNLTTQLAQARGRADYDAASRCVSATFWSVLVAAIVLAVLFAGLQSFIPWARVFNVTGLKASAEAPQAALLLGVIVSVQLFSALCLRIYFGLQRGYIGSIWQAIGAVASLVALLIVSQLQGGLSALVIALGFTPVAVQLAALGWVLFYGDYGGLLAPMRLSLNDYRAVINGGAMMFLVNLQAVFWLSKDNLLIAHAINLEQVGRYNTAFRVYMLVCGVLASSLGASLWPAYADAFARNDFEWIRSALRRSLLFGAGGIVLFSLFFIPFGHMALTWFAGVNLAASPALLAWLGLYFTILAIVNLLSFPLMGLGQVGVLAWGGLIGGVMSVPFGYFSLQHFGMVGLVVVNILCVTLGILTPLIIKTRDLGVLTRRKAA